MSQPDHPDGASGILFVSASPGVWGAETSLLLLAREMAAVGTPPRLLCRSADFAAAWPGPSEVVTGLALWRALLRAVVGRGVVGPGVAGRRVAAVVCCTFTLMPGVALLRLLPRRPRLVFDLHYVLPTSGGRRKVAAFAALFDGVVAVSHFATGHLGSRPDRVVIYRPVEPPARAAAPETPSGPAGGTQGGPSGDPLQEAVGVVGRIDPDKRLELVVAAVAQLPEVQLVVRGAGALDDTYAVGLTAHARKVLGDRVRFDGAVPSAAVMRGLRCLVVANDQETMGRTVVEAHLHRVPVVVPDRGGASELVEDGRTGRTFTAGDARSLADAVARSLTDRDGDVLQAAYDTAAQRHDPARVAAAYAAYVLDGTRLTARPEPAVLSG